MTTYLPGSVGADVYKRQECNDTVTAKIEVNLRALPSVTNPDATAVSYTHLDVYKRQA